MIEESTSPSTGVMNQIIKQSDVGIDLMYYLAKNTAEADRIAHLPDVLSQSMAMGVLEQKFKTPPPPPQPKVSGAPPPITPVGAGGSSVQKDVKDMDGDEYLEHMRHSRKK